MDTKLVFLVLFELVCVPSSFGQPVPTTGLDLSVKYSICYALPDNHTKLIKEAYIKDILDIGGVKFLHLTKFNVPDPDADEQISVNSIVAIMPATEAQDQDYAFCRSGKYKPK